LSLDLSGDLTGTVKRRVVFSPIGLSLGLSGELTGRRAKPTDLHLGLKLAGEMTGSVRLAIVIPAPILNEAAENAFADQCYAARLLGDGVEIKISSAVIEKPKNEIGMRVSANISQKQLSLISLDKNYTFQVGISSSPIVPLTWHTILEDAELDSRTFSRSFSNKAPNDSLSIGLFSPVTNKLNRGPASNIILYDPNKTEVSGDSIEAVYDNNGAAIGTQIVARSGLNLYAVLARLRSESGFSSIQTNIPNYEITRAEFGITQTFNQSVSPFIGVFQPLIFAVGNVLWILDKTAAIPDEFVPRAIVAANLENLSVSIPSGGVPDGFELSYIDSDRTANFYTTRTVTTFEESGIYGEAQYTRTDIVRTFRDWKNTNNPTSVLRTELLSEVHSVYNNSLVLIGRETQSFVFDAQGKQKSSERTVEATVPNLNAGGALALLTVREESQTIVYKPDPKNPRRFVQNRIVTQTRGLIAVDSENKYFDEDFRQDFVEAHKAGNLTVSMTSEFGPVKTVTEALHSLGNGQYQVRVSTVDHVRGTTTNSLSEPKTGDATLSAVGGRSSKKIVWRTGINQSNRSGIPPESFSGGEVPLAILEPLCQRILERRASGKHEGSVSVIGFDPSMDRGVFFSLYDRDNSYFGRYIAAGLRVTLDNLGVPYQQKVSTEIDCEEI
jgi:hypothetical protein